MNARQTIETLMQLGVHMKDAFTKFSLTSAKGWPEFLASPEGKAAETDIGQLLAQLTLGDIRSSVLEVQAKEKSFLNGRKIIDLSAADLASFHALLDAENALVLREVEKLGTVRFWQWLVNDALPVLVSVAKIVIPLLV